MRKNVFLNRTYFGEHRIYTIGKLGPVTQIGDYYFEITKEARKLRISIRDLKLKEVFIKVFRKSVSCDRIRAFAENFAKKRAGQVQGFKSSMEGQYEG